MKDEKELGKAIKEGQDTIVVEYDLAKKVLRIKATNKVAWGVCIAAICVAVGSVLTTVASGGIAAPVGAVVSMPAMAGAVAILGVGTAKTAVAIAVAAGSAGALNKLRDYDVEKISDTKIILHKRK